MPRFSLFYLALINEKLNKICFHKKSLENMQLSIKELVATIDSLHPYETIIFLQQLLRATMNVASMDVFSRLLMIVLFF